MPIPGTINKPFGIVIIAVYAGLYGLVEFLLGFALILTGSVLANSATLQEVSFIIFRGVFLSIFSIIQLTMTYGFWTLQQWGYKLAKALIIFSIPLCLYTFLWDRSIGNIFLQIITIAAAVLMLVYLHKPETQSLFN